jgi:hypothetical protein
MFLNPSGVASTLGGAEPWGLIHAAGGNAIGATFGNGPVAYLPPPRAPYPSSKTPVSPKSGPGPCLQQFGPGP